MSTRDKCRLGETIIKWVCRRAEYTLKKTQQRAKRTLCDRSERGQERFFVKGKIVSIFGIVGQRVTAATTQLCPCGRNAVMDRT